MQGHPASDLPPDCFQQAEVEAFQTFEGQTLRTVNYYLWRINPQSAFLYALELYFDHAETLLLSSGENTEGIQLISAPSLVNTAQQLKKLHNDALIQRIVADVQPLWRDVLGKNLLEIRLARHESGLYRNDALLFDFGEKQILLELGEKNGLILGVYDFE